MRPERHWTGASDNKKASPIGGRPASSVVLGIRFAYLAPCPPAHQPLPTGSEISTRPIMDRRVTGMVGISFLFRIIPSGNSCRRCQHTGNAISLSTRRSRGRCVSARSPRGRSDSVVLVKGKWQVSVLLWADMPVPLHRRATHWATRTPSGGDRCGVDTQRLRLRSRETDVE